MTQRLPNDTKNRTVRATCENTDATKFHQSDRTAQVTLLSAHATEGSLHASQATRSWATYFHQQLFGPLSAGLATSLKTFRKQTPNASSQTSVDEGHAFVLELVCFCFGDDSHRRDARHSHPCEDRRDAETAQ